MLQSVFCGVRVHLTFTMSVIVNFPDDKIAREAHFFLGMSFYHHGDNENANNSLSEYLALQVHSNLSAKAWDYKYRIAEAFRKGAKKHILGMKKTPQWVPAYSDAMEIFDEVIAALPSHELATKSLFGKAQLHNKDKEFRQAVDTYYTLIRRFPKHELAPESYLEIMRIYRNQSKSHMNDPDLLEIAMTHLNNFYEDFPRDERVAEAEMLLSGMKEGCAKSLYDIGQLYEKMNKPHAAVIYYTNAVKQFPTTTVAKDCQKRLDRLNKEVASLNISMDDPHG